MPDRQRKRRKHASTAQLNDIAKPSASGGPKKIGASRLFAPFRALGYITNHVPFSMFVHTPQGALAIPTVNVVTSVGRSWMMWDMAKMTLVFVGQCNASGLEPN